MQKEVTSGHYVSNLVNSGLTSKLGGRMARGLGCIELVVVAGCDPEGGLPIACQGGEYR
jgi:hypothetical protein